MERIKYYPFQYTTDLIKDLRFCLIRYLLVESFLVVLDAFFRANTSSETSPRAGSWHIVYRS